MIDEKEKCPCCNRRYQISKYVKKQKTKSDIVVLFENGETISEISKATGKHEYAIRSHLKYHGFEVERKVYSMSKQDIADAIDLYKQGNTLESIGEKFGVSRERIRQIMKTNNITGGLEIRLLLKSQDCHLKNELKDVKRENKIFLTYGISVDRYNQICNEMGRPSNKESPFFKWSRHKANSKKRNIPFKISFADWWKVWEESGKWNSRGRGHGYVMARYGDTDGYTIENVYICTSIENASDQYKSGKERKKPERNNEGKCKRGHIFDKVVVKENGRILRSCTICQKIHGKKYYEKLKTIQQK